MIFYLYCFPQVMNRLQIIWEFWTEIQGRNITSLLNNWFTLTRLNWKLSSNWWLMNDMWLAKKISDQFVIGVICFRANDIIIYASLPLSLYLHTDLLISGHGVCVCVVLVAPSYRYSRPSPREQVPSLSDNDLVIDSSCPGEIGENWRPVEEDWQLHNLPTCLLANMFT